MELEFDLVGVEPALANAFRRILLSEVESMAIKEVHMYMNTSVIQDEVLAHRIGLIPLKANPKQFVSQQEGLPFYVTYLKTKNLRQFNFLGVPPSEQDTLEFELKVKCTKNNNASLKATELSELYKNHAGNIF